MKADILVYYPSSWIGRLITWVTKGKVSHVCIVIEDDLVMDAGWFGIKLRKLDPHPHLTFIYPDLYEEQRETIVKYAMETVDCRYDYRQFLSVGLYKLFGIKLSWMKVNEFLCVEHVYKAYMSVGIDIVPQIEDDAYTVPEDILSSPVLIQV
jgi:hypothetical protein